jgi:hypothetical protein
MSSVFTIDRGCRGIAHTHANVVSGRRYPARPGYRTCHTQTILKTLPCWARYLAISRFGRSALDCVADFLPECPTVFLFIFGQSFQRVRFAQSRQVRIGGPIQQELPRDISGIRGLTVEHLAPCHEVGPQPLASLLAPGRPILIVELVCVVAQSASGQDCASRREKAGGRFEVLAGIAWRFSSLCAPDAIGI